MARPFMTCAFIAARGFLGNYRAYRVDAQHWKMWRKVPFVGSAAGPEKFLDDRRKEIYRGAWEAMREQCVATEMVASVASIDRMLEYLKRDSAEEDEFYQLGEELEQRLYDETKGRTFFSLTLKETECFEKPRAGWEAIIERFPDAAGDVEEARKCFALSRYAAAVFHSLQIVESGLIELGLAIGVTDPKSGWTATTNALRKIVSAKHEDRTPFQRQHIAFFEQIHGTIEGLKNAWRNKISHAQGRLVLMTADFSPEVAEEILFASRAFMRRLAEDAPSPEPLS